ncbi:MAG: 16S rRNA (cytosine(967)-C(5))-methyltransferase RsmB [Steroidobacteraceae bacterium]
MSSASIRAAAARVVAAVATEGRTLEEALAQLGLPAQDRPVVQSLAWGCVRGYPRLQALFALMADRPGKRVDPEVRSLVLLGLHQLEEARTPAHAAVAETVEAARLMGHARATGFINALLRRFQREGVALVAALPAGPATRLGYPAWLVEQVEADWPSRVESILAAGNQHPPMWLRVNRQRIDPSDYAERLVAAGHEASPWASAPEALRLARPVDVAALPGFAEGEVSVQDAAAQLAARLLSPPAGARVLDACAAPGGKACHLLELAGNSIELLALDIDPERCRRVEDNFARLGLRGRACAGDLLNPASWWDGRHFDSILLDVPCSGSGVIRRHPDIKLLRRPGDLAGLAARQRNMLGAAWSMLRPGGRLLYATCSMFRVENQAVVSAFLASTPDAVESSESARLRTPGQLPAVAGPDPGFNLLPGEADTDGFYYACLERRA